MLNCHREKMHERTRQPKGFPCASLPMGLLERRAEEGTQGTEGSMGVTMKKWFTSKEARKITGIIFVLCTVLVAQIFGFLQFNLNLYEMSLEHSTQQVNELSKYVEKNLQLELERYIHVLKVVELQLESEELFSPEMADKLDKAYQISKFRMMGVSDLDGKGICSRGNAFNICYEDIREHILNDEVYISNVLKNESETLIFLAVPFKQQGEIRGILWGKYALEDLVQHIELSDEAYQYFQIIDDKGNYLLRSDNKFVLNNSPLYFSDTIWVELRRYQYPEGISIQKIRESIQKQWYFTKVSGVEAWSFKAAPAALTCRNPSRAEGRQKP